jgi:cytochrome c oxidase cbb3-type subunit 3
MKNKNIAFILVTFMLLLQSAQVWAAADTEQGGGSYFYDNFLATGLLLFAGLAIVGAFWAIFQLLNIMVKVQQIRIYEEKGMTEFLKEVKKPKESMWQRLYKRWTNVVPIEKEKDVLMDHNYDGIRELDNSLPPWWVAMFYITIAFAVVYMTYNHFAGYGLSSAEKYEREMEEAQEEVQAYLAKQANLVDETNVEVLTDQADLEAGKIIFNTQCAVCHGTMGEGGIGPNMTDQYWIHGGSIKDIFRTVKYGVPDKGMISWKSQLSAGDMAKVSSYILTLVGTDPPNQKEPQGELYQEQVEMEVQDTTGSQAVGMVQ